MSKEEIHLKSVVKEASLNIESEELPIIPDALFDQIYNLKTAPKCRVKEHMKTCSKVCEPGPDNAHGENLLLLPGEAEYLRKRLSKRDIEYKWINSPPVVVRLNEECPYHINGTCSIHDDRPFICRSYPLRCHKIGSRSLAVYSAMGCPYNVPTIESLRDNDHHRRWIGAWKALIPYLSEKWWISFVRACPAGFRHIADIMDPDEDGVPFHMAKKHADPNCPICNGEGIDYSQGMEICSCLDRKARRKLLNDFDQHRKRFIT